VSTNNVLLSNSPGPSNAEHLEPSEERSGGASKSYAERYHSYEDPEGEHFLATRHIVATD
jgi:hypothetical protein